MPHKYAQFELERRWLLTSLPKPLQNSDTFHLITDRYIIGTPLRLRRMENAVGQVVALKLTQKYQAVDQSAYATTITNFYLDGVSYETLLSLPAKTLRKKRYPLQNGRYKFSIDQFVGSLTGLLLAEIEQPDMPSLMQTPQPIFAQREVTEEPAFTGGELVQLTAEQFLQWRQSW
jgi:CYTH domain-containing protein